MTENIGYDPRLKVAMSEILEVAQRYDVAVAVMLVSPSHSEYAYQYPNWSPLQYHGEADSDGRVALRFRAKAEQFPDRASDKSVLEAGVHLVEHLRRFGAQTHKMFDTLMTILEQQLEIKRDPRRHRSSQPGDMEASARYRQGKGPGYWDNNPKGR